MPALRPARRIRRCQPAEMSDMSDRGGFRDVGVIDGPFPFEVRARDAAPVPAFQSGTVASMTFAVDWSPLDDLRSYVQIMSGSRCPLCGRPLFPHDQGACRRALAQWRPTGLRFPKAE